MNTEILHFHLFGGIGGGAIGFNQGEARVGTVEGKFRCLGGIDVVPDVVKDFTDQVGVNGTVLDLFDRQQYIDWHGKEPGPEWKEATPADIQKAAGNESPNIVFTSPPCKGFSGLLSQKKSESVKYRALNRLTLRGIWLSLEAWKDDLPEFFLLENVPRIENRGEELLIQIERLLEQYGYATARTTHDCGEIGGLAQSRRRFLLVARQQEKVPNFLYEPVTRPLLSVGSVLEKLPMPGDIETAGEMHAIPKLQWKTWVRLAFVEAGKDWRSLKDLRVENGHLTDFTIVPENYGYADALGVCSWDSNTGAVTGRSGPTNGRFAVPDPRFSGYEFSQYGVYKWSDSTGVVTGQKSPGQGKFSVADPRPGLNPDRVNYQTGGHYGVVDWSAPAGSVTGRASYDKGRWSVADPNLIEGDSSNGLPAGDQSMVAMIRALDDTWHRPFTTYELAALQGLIDPDEPQLVLTGKSHSQWRERIGNMVPPPAAKAIASVIGQTILLARSGETFVLGQTPIWVRPIAIASTIQTPEIYRDL
ncbi:MAG: DNA cytosine methyltransferase [Oceanospirillaceae bacterium]|nr:DNA cytosine methyltransferase [Oceanospirillaceae bacterium]